MKVAATNLDAGPVVAFQLEGAECLQAAEFAINTLFVVLMRSLTRLTFFRKNAVVFLSAAGQGGKDISEFFKLRESTMAI
jgi:hypothetical protein